MILSQQGISTAAKACDDQEIENQAVVVVVVVVVAVAVVADDLSIQLEVTTMS